MQTADASLVDRYLDYSVREVFSDLDQLRTGVAIYDAKFELVFANKRIRSYLPDLYAALDAGASLINAIEAQLKVNFPSLTEEQYLDRTLAIAQKIKNEETMELDTLTGIRLKSAYSRTDRGSYILTTSDITDHIKYEAQLAEARVIAEKANRAKSVFLANMSHEIRTPMSGVFMAAQLLQRKLRDTNQPELLELADTLVRSANHLGDIINDVLTISKIEAGQIELSPMESSLVEILENLIKSQKPIAERSGLDLNLVVDTKLPKRLIIDPLRVRQCVTNLLGNALKFTPSGHVTLAVMFDPDIGTVTIHVADTGIGIAPDHQDRVFEEFKQASADTSNGFGGTGLGLPISRNLAMLMGGDLKVTSEFGKGSIFTLTFESQLPDDSAGARIQAA